MRETKIYFLIPWVLMLYGCGEDKTKNTGDDVPISEFCSLFDQDYCKAHVNCCSNETKDYNTVDECIAASPCSNFLGQILASSAVANGTIIYDPAAAGDYLRAKAKASSLCGADPNDPRKMPFLIGTLGPGEDCGGEDVARFKVCAPRLACFDNDDGRSICSVIRSKPRGAHGDSCTDDEDFCWGTCVNGSCIAEPDDIYCADPHIPPHPSNAGAPYYLSLKTGNKDNSGTSNTSVEIYYRVGNGNEYWCDVAPSTNSTEYTCSPWDCCPADCTDQDGDGYGWNCDSGSDCNDKASDCHEGECCGTACIDEDGDDVGWGCDFRDDCNDNDDSCPKIDSSNIAVEVFKVKNESIDGLRVTKVSVADENESVIKSAKTFQTSNTNHGSKCDNWNSCDNMWIRAFEGYCEWLQVEINSQNLLSCF